MTIQQQYRQTHSAQSQVQLKSNLYSNDTVRVRVCTHRLSQHGHEPRQVALHSALEPYPTNDNVQHSLNQNTCNESKQQFSFLSLHNLSSPALLSLFGRFLVNPACWRTPIQGIMPCLVDYMPSSTTRRMGYVQQSSVTYVCLGPSRTMISMG